MDGWIEDGSRIEVRERRFEVICDWARLGFESILAGVGLGLSWSEEF
jgi:hypothetical protein